MGAMPLIFVTTVLISCHVCFRDWASVWCNIRKKKKSCVFELQVMTVILSVKTILACFPFSGIIYRRQIAGRGHRHSQWDREVLCRKGRQSERVGSPFLSIWVYVDLCVVGEVWALNYLHCLKFPFLLYLGIWGTGRGVHVGDCKWNIPRWVQGGVPLDSSSVIA